MPADQMSFVLEMQAQTMELTPSSRNTMPTVMPMAATLTHGSIRQMKPASVKRMPTARIHPHARTPRARRSNELTHCDTPENSSHSVNRNVNGEVCTMRGKKIHPGDTVAYDGEELTVSYAN